MPKPGCFTASSFPDAMKNGRDKKSPGETAIKVAYEVAMERLGVEREEITAPALEWGNEWEAVAKRAYEAEKFCTVTDFDLPVIHPELPYVAGTPDGWAVEGEGLIEIKCPYNPTNHMLNIANRDQVSNYYAQMQGYMWITGAKWCDFVSYDPRFPESLRLCVYRIDRDQDFIDQLSDRIKLLNEMADSLIQSIISPPAVEQGETIAVKFV